LNAAKPGSGISSGQVADSSAAADNKRRSVGKLVQQRRQQQLENPYSIIIA